MSKPPATNPPALDEPRRELSLLDTTSIIVGIIIGSAIYEISPLVVRTAGGWAVGLVLWLNEVRGAQPPSAATLSAAALFAVVGVWLVGGLVALVGALCYAELATTYPHAGGTYVFLTEGLGRWVGLAFAWAEFWIVRPGNVGAVAFVLARYGVQLLPPRMQQAPRIELALALVSIFLLAVLNACGLRAGKWTQNLLTGAKVTGLIILVLTALSVPGASTESSVTAPPNIAGLAAGANVSLALILIMFAYGGWADMSFVAAEVRQPGRNILRALWLGTGAVVVLYLAVNLAFLWSLGMAGLSGASAAAAEVMSLRFGQLGARAISLLVVVSCLGAINGMLLAGSRVFYALGTQHATFAWLGAWNSQTGVPLRSLVLQTIITLALVSGFGMTPDNTERVKGFAGLVIFTGPFYWTFIGLVGLALIVLRRRGVTGGAFRVPLYPVSPLIFWLTSMAMVYAAVQYIVVQAREAVASQGRVDFSWRLGAAWSAAVIVSGIIVGIVDQRQRR